jgi:tetratricopeptide (TPR) repeat protein
VIAALLASTAAPSLSQSKPDTGRLIDIARKDFEVKNFDGALQIYNKILSTNPQDGSVYLLRGMCLEFLDRSKAAAADFDRGLRLTEPTSGATYESAAKAYNDTHQTEKAMKLLEAGIKMFPNSPLYRMKGQMLWQQDKYNEALACFDKAVQLNPKEYWNYSDRVGCLMQTKHWKAALADLNTMVKLRPTEARTYAMRARAYDMLGDTANAAKDRSKGKELGKDAWFEP